MLRRGRRLFAAREHRGARPLEFLAREFSSLKKGMKLLDAEIGVQLRFGPVLTPFTQHAPDIDENTGRDDDARYPED